MRVSPLTPVALLMLLPVCASFAPQQHHIIHRGDSRRWTSTKDSNNNKNDDGVWRQWANEYGIEAPKLSVRQPLDDERGKGGVHALESIAALEVMMRVPRNLILATCDMPSRAAAAAAEANEFSWAADLTAAALVVRYPDADDNQDDTTAVVLGKKTWVEGWTDGGWATNGADLGPPDVPWGAKSVTGSLLATGSDNDHNIYAKFRFPCHPVIHRASLGLTVLTGANEDVTREALSCRGRNYRSMQDALFPLVTTPTERDSGSLRERRSWDVADMLSRVLSRATTLELDDANDDDSAPTTYCVVPLHERLAHCATSSENSKLVACGDEVLLVAARDIEAGEAITRDYTTAPQLNDDTSDGALRLLLQFGVPPM
jgi:hypothetical protein